MKRNRTHRRVGWILFLLSLLALFLLLASGRRGFWQQIRLKQEQRRLQQDIDSLKQEKIRLQAEKEKLDDPKYIEEIAREEYGMAKKNEDVYKVVPEKDE